MLSNKRERAERLASLVGLHTDTNLTVDEFMALDDKMLAVLESFGRLFITYYVMGRRIKTA